MLKPRATCAVLPKAPENNNIAEEPATRKFHGQGSNSQNFEEEGDEQAGWLVLALSYKKFVTFECTQRTRM